MNPRTTPGTEAGRLLWERVQALYRRLPSAVGVVAHSDVRAIEAEALATYRAGLRERVAGLLPDLDMRPSDRSAVLALLSDPSPEPETKE